MPIFPHPSVSSPASPNEIWHFGAGCQATTSQEVGLAVRFLLSLLHPWLARGSRCSPVKGAISFAAVPPPLSERTAPDGVVAVRLHRWLPIRMLESNCNKIATLLG